MNLTSLLTIIAIVLGPVIAIQVQKYLERNREKKNTKVQIFKSLMATRGSVLSAVHVEALNRIDLEFSGDKKYKKVIESWKEYFDNLKQGAEEEPKIWIAKNEELLANLLYEMGNSLGFSFDKVLIKRNVYSPQGHINIETEYTLIRQLMIKLLTGEISLQVESTAIVDEESLSKQKELQEFLLNHYKNKEPINVKLVEQ